MTVKILVITRTGSERTYLDPKDTYIFQNKDGSHILVHEDGEIHQRIIEAADTSVIPSTGDQRIWDCFLDDEGGEIKLNVTQHRVIGWRLHTSLINEQQTMVPLAPTLDGQSSDYKGAGIFLLDSGLKTAYQVIRRDGGYIEMDETGSTDLLALMSHVLKHTITADMLPSTVFTDEPEGTLISPTTKTRSA